MFLKISQNSQENTSARVSFLIKLQASGLGPATLLKKRLSYRRFPVNFEKFPRTPFFTEHLWPTALVHLFLIQRYTNLFAFYKPCCFISKDFVYFILQPGSCIHSFLELFINESCLLVVYYLLLLSFLAE